MERGNESQLSPSNERNAHTSLQFSFPATPQKVSGRWTQVDACCDSPAKRDLFSCYGAKQDAPTGSAPSSSGSHVRLNVGGEAFETCLDTLTKCGDSYFTALFSRWQDGAKDVTFIDRDGHLFRHVLNYLRTGLMPLEDKAQLLALMEEANFYILPSLEDACREKLADLAAKEQQLQVMLAAREEERKQQFQQEMQRQQQVLQKYFQTLIPATRAHECGPMMMDGSPQEGNSMLAHGRVNDLEQIFRMDDDF